ncbi:uncharacterized protein B0I36DRAFT_352770 [Microdochium trichocladiopsis]|uniref:DUF8212 domain-containing protein n=1 Tax=Microdochium trichocladiopsis TaxID=1682393 RepID=A0A9P8XXB1_9PEZI|nr:uncharacterized protein B0I36DRAFT_352770 [Microdochium trichocladiopsis]KAH7024543.1 hypothetical protein B0I36DRAFT_352770 [Microdochium trichocladiopsis]
MPLLYGEGSRAFGRLLEEIMRRSDDQSIFAYGDLIDDDNEDASVPHDIDAATGMEVPASAAKACLPDTPAAFRSSDDISWYGSRSGKHFYWTQKGIVINQPSIALPSGELLAPIACSVADGTRHQRLDTRRLCLILDAGFESGDVVFWRRGASLTLVTQRYLDRFMRHRDIYLSTVDHKVFPHREALLVSASFWETFCIRRTYPNLYARRGPRGVTYIHLHSRFPRAPYTDNIFLDYTTRGSHQFALHIRFRCSGVDMQPLTQHELTRSSIDLYRGLKKKALYVCHQRADYSMAELMLNTPEYNEDIFHRIADNDYRPTIAWKPCTDIDGYHIGLVRLPDQRFMLDTS